MSLALVSCIKILIVASTIFLIDIGHCGAHLINKGLKFIYLDQDYVFIEFELDGRTSAQTPLSASCTLDGSPLDGACKSFIYTLV